MPSLGYAERVNLAIEDPCWFHMSEDHVLTCTVYSMDWTIKWRRDNVLITLNGKPVGEKQSLL